MIDIPLLDDTYREAFLYLLDEIDIVMLCFDVQKPWYPRDEERLEDALRVYGRWHPDPEKNPILDFSWPQPGEVPKVQDGYLKPTAEEKKKIQDFIDKNEGSGMDPLTEILVQLAKDLIREIH